MVGDGVVGMDFSGTEVAEIFPIWESQHTSFIKPFPFSTAQFDSVLPSRVGLLNTPSGLGAQGCQLPPVSRGIAFKPVKDMVTKRRKRFAVCPCAFWCGIGAVRCGEGHEELPCVSRRVDRGRLGGGHPDSQLYPDPGSRIPPEANPQTGTCFRFVPRWIRFVFWRSPGTNRGDLLYYRDG